MKRASSHCKALCQPPENISAAFDQLCLSVATMATVLLTVVTGIWSNQYLPTPFCLLTTVKKNTLKSSDAQQSSQGFASAVIRSQSQLLQGRLRCDFNNLLNSRPATRCDTNLKDLCTTWRLLHADCAMTTQTESLRESLSACHFCALASCCRSPRGNE